MIAGEHVRLRPIHASDLPTLRRWFADPVIMRGWATPQPIVPDTMFEEDLAGRFTRFDESGYFAIETVTGDLIGRIEFENLDELQASTEIMLIIGEPAARQRGYGRDALVALLGYLFRQRGLNRVELTVIADNDAARRTYAAVGFLEEGRLRDHLWFDGRYHDEIAMAILRANFEERWPVSGTTASLTTQAAPE